MMPQDWKYFRESVAGWMYYTPAQVMSWRRMRLLTDAPVDISSARYVRFAHLGLHSLTRQGDSFTLQAIDVSMEAQ